MRKIRIVPVALALAGLALLAACGGDDPAAPATTPLDPVEAEQWTTTMLDLINGMVVDVPALAAGDFVPVMQAKAEGDPVWDETQQAWVFDATIDLTEGDPPTSTGQLGIHAWVQFRNAEGPLPTALGATELEYRYTESMTLHASGDGTTVDMAFTAQAGMIVAYVEGGYAVEGGGDATVNATQTAGGRTERLHFAMGWGTDLTLPLGGCPDGAAWVEVGAYRLDADYDGQGNVAWNLVGPGASAEGAEVISCGPAN